MRSVVEVKAPLLHKQAVYANSAPNDRAKQHRDFEASCSAAAGAFLGLHMQSLRPNSFQISCRDAGCGGNCLSVKARMFHLSLLSF